MFLGTPWEGVTAGAMLGAGLILAIGAQNAFVLLRPITGFAISP